jgi:hypothetical protein
VVDVRPPTAKTVKTNAVTPAWRGSIINPPRRFLREVLPHVPENGSTLTPAIIFMSDKDSGLLQK